mmetsp:Transcript_18199/g.30187  ORF Transcript_18199/g.30187 Transcript_18199/m.30187 type:complete len:87 (+) Transcript_18199:228-488(+)
MFSFDTFPLGIYTVVETNNSGLSGVTDSDAADPNIISADVTNGDSGGNFFVDGRPSASPSTNPFLRQLRRYRILVVPQGQLEPALR